MMSGKCSQCEAKMEPHNKNEPSYCRNCGAVPGAFTARTFPKPTKVVSEPVPTRPSAAGWMSQTRASGQSEVNFARALSEVISLAECLSLPGPVMSRAGGICKKAFADLSITRAFSLKVLAASSVYVASCQVAMGVTINEVAESGEVLRSEAIKCSRKLQRRLRVILPTPTPQEYTPRILAAMKVSPQDPLAVETLKMIGEADSRAIQGKNPAGVACAAVYTISKKLGRGITMRALSRVGYVTEATIRNACSSLSP